MKYYEAIQFEVGPEHDGWRLDTVLRQGYGLSRRLLVRLKKTEKGIMVNGERAWTHRIMKTGDRIELYMEMESSEQIIPEPLPLNILYEDEHLLVLDKPAGIIVHPTHGHYRGTIANGVVHYWKSRGESYRFRPVHRLDEWTSGVLVVAKNHYADQQISKQILAGTMEREYTAIVHGHPPQASGVIDAPIARDPVQPALRIVSNQGAEAKTWFETVDDYGIASKLRLCLVTGRTHQIRVHMLHVGCPLIGDPLYTTPEWKKREEKMPIKRQALHASRIAFLHPVSKAPVSFTSPLPADIVGLIESICKMPE